jgi:hypothetical protein
MIPGMSQPVVVVGSTTEDSASETGAVAAAATEAVSDAFRTGVMAGEDAARVERDGMVTREEFDELARRLLAVEETALVAVVTAEAAAEVAVEAVQEGAGDDVDGSGSDGEGDGSDGEPRPPEKRTANEPGGNGSESSPSNQTTTKAKGYGAPGWYGSRG